MCDCVTKVVGGPPPTITVCFALPCGSPTCCSYAVFVLSLGLLLRVLCKNAGRAVHVADQNALMILCSEIRLPRSLTHFPSLALDVCGLSSWSGHEALMIFAPVPRVLLAFSGSDYWWSISLMRSMRLGALNRWRTERVQLSKHAAASSPLASARVCERIVVFNKCDLVPEWGIKVCI